MILLKYTKQAMLEAESSFRGCREILRAASDTVASVRGYFMITGCMDLEKELPVYFREENRLTLLETKLKALENSLNDISQMYELTENMNIEQSEEGFFPIQIFSPAFFQTIGTPMISDIVID